MTAKEYQALELEASVEERVTAWLEAKGYTVHPLVTEVERGYRGRSRRNPVGTPDLIAVKFGWHAWSFDVRYFELKRAKGGRLGDAQKKRIAELRGKGFSVFVHQSNGTDVIEQLKEWFGE